MDTFETLQDFALHLLNNPQAFSAFQTDPEAALGAAGLGDVSALDVQEILPLVLDYAPTQGLGEIGTAFDALPVLDDSPISGVVGQDLAGAFSPVTDLGQGLDADVLDGPLDIVGQSQVTDLVGDLTTGANVLDTTQVTTAVQDVATGDLSGVTDNALNLTDVVSDIGNVGDVTSGISGIGDITDVADIDHIDVGGVLSGNDVSF